MEEGWPSENEVLPSLNNTEEILPQKMGEQIVYICLSADMLEDLSDTNVIEQEVTQSCEHGVKEMAPQQLRQSEIIQKSNPEYANVAIIEDGVNEPETYEEVSQNLVWQKAMEEEIIILEQNQTWELVSRSKDIKSIFCKWIYEMKCTPNGSIVRYKDWTI